MSSGINNMNNKILVRARNLLGAPEFSVSQTPLEKTLWSLNLLLGITGWTDCAEAPEAVVVLGSGLGGFEKRLTVEFEIPFCDIHLPAPGIDGHSGRLFIGTINGRRVAVLSGRVHYYEGHDFETVCRAVRTMALLGVKRLLLSNAAGGVNPNFSVGDLMLITDHINFMGDNPLRGPNPGTLGPRFPDMTTTWTPHLRELFLGLAAAGKIDLKQGVYLAASGPSYETPAEIRMFRALGADAVGMSTVPEAIAGRHAGMEVAGVSCITNLAAGMGKGELSHEEVKAVGAAAGTRLGDLFEAVVANLPEDTTEGA
jgi:purine-nucleoside phosphorylase